MTRTRTSLGLVGAWLLCGASGCAGGGEPSRDAAPGPAPLPVATTAGGRSAVVSEPIDLTGALARARLAFEHDGGALVGRLPSHQVHIDATGKVDVTPSGRARGKAATAVFETKAVSRGATSLLSRASTRIDGDGSALIERGAVSERWRNGAGASEQSWAFATRPAGKGDLSVRVKVAGQQYRRETAAGLHFVDQATGVGMRYGHGTWIDASGSKTAIKAEVIRDEIVLRVPAAVVDSSGYPAVLDPQITSEVPVDAPVPHFTRDEQNAPRVAFDGTNFLVVWEDERRSLNDNDVYATRVSQAGEVLDPFGIQIVAKQANDQLAPKVAFGGGVYLVVWQDASTNPASIFAARVTPAGQVLDPSGVDLSKSTGLSNSETRPQVAFNGADFVVSYDANNEVRAIRVGTDGQPKGAVTTISATTGNQTTSDIECIQASGQCVVAWFDTRNEGAGDVYAARLAADGTVQDTTGIAIDTTAGSAQDTVAVGATASTFAVLYRSTEATAAGDVFGKTLAADGTLGAKTQICNTCRSASMGYVPTLDQYAIAFTTNLHDPNLRFADGNLVLGGTTYALGLTGDANSNAWLGVGTSHLLTTWQDMTTSWNREIFAARLDLATFGLPDTPPIRLSRGANAQYRPEVAFNGTHYLVVWSDFRNTTAAVGDIYAMLLDRTGKQVLAQPIEILKDAQVQQNLPQVATIGSDFLVTWRDQRATLPGSGTYAARVSAAGALLDPGGVRVGLLTDWHSLACRSATDCVVVQNSGANMLSIPLTIGASITAGATQTLQTGGVSIALQPYTSVAWNGSHYLATWVGLTGANEGIRGALLTPAGALSGTAFDIINNATDELTPTVAAVGSDFFVAWHDRRNEGAGDIYGMFIGDDGTLKQPSGIELSKVAGSAQTVPTVVADGTRALVAWLDARTVANSTDVYGTWVNSDGSVTHPLGLALSTNKLAENRPSLGSTGDGQVILVYDREAEEQPYGTDRVFARFVYFDGGQGGPCSSNLDCYGGLFTCVDGVCCDTTCGDGDPSDCQACSKALGAALDGVCGPVNAGAVCRAKAGACDAVEQCDGASIACPADLRLGAGTVCRTVAGPCDVAETCDGAQLDCPADLFSQGSTCRPVAGPCDVAESCDGTQAACPTDTFVAQGTECRAATGPCDVAESCDGAQAACPPNAVASAGTTCRPSAGACDVPETCDGLLATCPFDVVAQQGVPCRDSAGECDLAEACDGAAPSCPTDANEPDGTVCSAGVCSAGVCGPAGGGGASGAGGSSQGGSSQGGSAQGGTAQGGSSQGGTAQGGSSQGGTAQGGSSQGGTAQGGSSQGGTAQGGSSQGGTAQGGAGGSAETCSQSSECASGFCVDGFCCDKACDATCEACSAAKKGYGADGTCGFVVNGIDPEGECDEQAPNSCGTTGVCDGEGACARYPSGTLCGQQCADGVVSQQLCDDSGTCVAGAQLPCAPFGCADALSCGKTCTINADCGAGSECKQGVCLGKGTLGTSCSTADDCASGHCVDGVCCNTACGALCEACSAKTKGSGDDGTCGFIEVGTDPDDECEPDEGFPQSCLGDGMCNGKGKCRAYAPAATPCGDTSCVGGVVNGLLCNGGGQCQQAELPCPPAKCDAQGKACLQTCGGDDDCTLENAYCSTSGVCSFKRPLGATCGGSKECLSNNCVDGVCCSSECAGTCQYCAQPGNEGTCVTLSSGKPKKATTACGDPGSGCEGVCTGAVDCQLPDEGTSCQPGSCSGNVEQPPGLCDGAGKCAVPPTKSCGDYACDEQGGVCKTTCSLDADCKAGSVCDTAKSQCAPAAGTCADAFTVQEPDGDQISCKPYRCENGACRDSCADTTDCAQGFVCQQSTCVAGAGGAAGSSGAGGAAGSAQAGKAGASASGGKAQGGGAAGKGGSGGLPGSPASAGKAGSTAASAGSNATPAPPAEAPAEDEGGCGCRTAGAPASPVGALALCAGALALVRRRRRVG